jgi:hypothetical protein
VLVEIDWTGDVARAYVGDRLICDQFFTGRPWPVELADLTETEAATGLTIRVLPAPPGADIHVSPSVQPAFAAGRDCARVNSVTLVHSVVRTVAAIVGETQI